MRTFTTNPERTLGEHVSNDTHDSADVANNQDEIDRRTAELLCEVVKAGSGRTITPEQLLANARHLCHTNT